MSARVRRPIHVFRPSYPDQLAKLRAAIGHTDPYLSDEDLEELYRDYSDREWCAGWIGLGDETLAGFIEWLQKPEGT